MNEYVWEVTHKRHTKNYDYSATVGIFTSLEKAREEVHKYPREPIYIWRYTLNSMWANPKFEERLDDSGV